MAVRDQIEVLVRTTFGGLTRSALMSRVRSRGNLTTELRMMRLLRQNKLAGWRRHFRIAGHPDFCWPRERVALFVHGCFWHGHNCGRNLEPRSNGVQWREKIRRNRQRDARVTRLLRQSGWAVLAVWECRLQRRPESCIRRIQHCIFQMRLARKQRKP